MLIVTMEGLIAVLRFAVTGFGPGYAIGNDKTKK